jgi:hypothetical protein
MEAAIMVFYIVPKCCYFHPVLLKLHYYLLWSVAPKRGEEWLCASKLAKIADSSPSSSQLTLFLQKAYLVE